MAEKIRGELTFPKSPLIGRVGRGMMGKAARRPYGANVSSLTIQLKRNLLWKLRAIGDLPPRIIPLAILSPVSAYLDAQGFGHVAARGRVPL